MSSKCKMEIKTARGHRDVQRICRCIRSHTFSPHFFSGFLTGTHAGIYPIWKYLKRACYKAAELPGTDDNLKGHECRFELL